MKILLGAVLFSALAIPAWAEQPSVVYPPANHQTTSDRIFLIGTAPPTGKVLVNGKPIERSRAGHFAPTFPLQLGDNLFTLQYQNRQVQIKVKRLASTPEPPIGLAFGKDSLTPSVDIARLPGELVCFGAIAPPNARVLVKLGTQRFALWPQPQTVQLPANSGLLIGNNQPIQPVATQYQGCTTLPESTNFLQFGNNIIRGAVIPSTSPPPQLETHSVQTNREPVGVLPEFELTLNGKTTTQKGTGRIAVLSPAQLEVVEVVADEGVARTGPGTDYSRLTPLPKSTRAAVTGREGEWLRLDYGGWINSKETRIIPGAIPPRSLIRSITSRQVSDATEIVFPLQVPVPVSIQQGNRTLTLTLYNTTAQTDVIRLDDNQIVSRLDWQQVAPDSVQYTFNFKTGQQWGYKLRYEGTSLILTLRHPPRFGGGAERTRGTRGPHVSEAGRSPVGIRGEGDKGTRGQGDNYQLPVTNFQSKIQNSKSLTGIKILLDPGHGGSETGSKGPTGYPEKDINLLISKLVRERLEQQGATVYMTRESDKEVSLPERVATIDKIQPAIALSLHYNALPDGGDAMNTKGVAAFWYHPQAHDLAVFLHNYIVKQLNRPSYGVYWNNLALTRPASAPSVLLELGFMINPNEFEWIVNPQEQKKLANAIAEGITHYLLDVAQ